MKICTIGSGFIKEHLSFPHISSRIDNSSKLVGILLDKEKPDVLINCIGKTGRPNIDWCESNREATACANTSIPIILAEECQKRSIHMIQIGSGCIYFGASPDSYLIKNGLGTSTYEPGWKETDFANPKSFYSKSKYACDLVLGDMKHVTTLRIRMPISNKNNPRNLINKLLAYKQIIDIPNSMTFMSDLQKCIDWAIKGTHTGIYHVVNPQPVTAAQIMEEYQKHIPSHSFDIITEEQLDGLTIAKRSNCILNSDKLKNAGFFMTPSEVALKKCMEEYVKNI